MQFDSLQFVFSRWFWGLWAFFVSHFAILLINVSAIRASLRLLFMPFVFEGIGNLKINCWCQTLKSWKRHLCNCDLFYLPLSVSTEMIHVSDMTVISVPSLTCCVVCLVIVAQAFLRASFRVLEAKNHQGSFLLGTPLIRNHIRTHLISLKHS